MDGNICGSTLVWLSNLSQSYWQTDRIPRARPRLHCMQRGKKYRRYYW